MFFFLFLKFNNGNFSFFFFFVDLCYFCLWQIISLYFLSFPPSKPVLHRALAVLLAQPFFFFSQTPFGLLAVNGRCFMVNIAPILF